VLTHNLFKRKRAKPILQATVHPPLMGEANSLSRTQLDDLALAKNPYIMPSLHSSSPHSVLPRILFPLGQIRAFFAQAMHVVVVNGVCGTRSQLANSPTRCNVITSKTWLCWHRAWLPVTLIESRQSVGVGFKNLIR
jgi:hypothetical protein